MHLPAVFAVVSGPICIGISALHVILSCPDVFAMSERNAVPLVMIQCGVDAPELNLLHIPVVSI